MRRLAIAAVLAALLLAPAGAVAAPSHQAIVAACVHRSTPPAGWGIAPFRWRAYCFLHGRP